MYTNPYFSSSPITPPIQRTDIVHVNGENGAKAFQMAPNSNILLLDDTAPIIWLKQTDGAGYPTLTPYSITPYKPEPPVDLKSLEARLERLEARFNDKSTNEQSHATEITSGQSELTESTKLKTNNVFF